MSFVITEDYSRIADLMQEGIIIVDKDCRILFINAAYEEFTGLNRHEVIGQPLPKIRPTSMLPEIMKWKKPLYDTIRQAFNKESFCDFIPIMDGDEVTGGMVVVRDSHKITSLIKSIKVKKSPPIDRSASSFKARFTFDSIIGSRSGLKNTVSTCSKASITDSPVLLIGESGTGKEIIAQAIHNGSDRRDYPFIDVNCAALPESLLESELFGYEEGSFTGGKKSGKKGLFELANGGTLFLDEITELPFNLQAKLLRVLQEKSIRKIGGLNKIDLDVRLIAATNKNIHKLMEENLFRQDLYFRLAVFVIEIPALRDRKQDIPLFVNAFINEQQKEKQRLITINKAALKLLIKYNWPGNVRELKNTIEYVCNMVEDTEIGIPHLPPSIINNSISVSDLKDTSNYHTLNEATENFEKDLIEKYLSVYGNSVDSKKIIASELNISLATLYNKIKKYNISSE